MCEWAARAHERASRNPARSKYASTSLGFEAWLSIFEQHGNDFSKVRSQFINRRPL